MSDTLKGSPMWKGNLLSCGTTDIMHVWKNMTVLADDIFSLMQQLDRLNPESPAAKRKERSINVKLRKYHRLNKIVIYWPYLY